MASKGKNEQAKDMALNLVLKVINIFYWVDNWLQQGRGTVGSINEYPGHGS